MEKIITILMILLCLPVVQASWTEEISEVAINITEPYGPLIDKLWSIDYYVYKNTNHTFAHSARPLKEYWLSGTGDCRENDTKCTFRVGDCTEIARVQHRMYKSIGVKSRIVHGCIMINDSCSKHDYVEYYNNSTWSTTEDRYFNRTLVKRGWGIW